MLARLRALGRDPKSADFTDYQVVKLDLWRAQFYKCCFCEHKITAIYNAVEHFRPKAGANRDPGCTEKHGYWWLAYSWENLLLACPVCNSSGKGIRFPLDHGSSALQAEQHPPGDERPLLLDPAGGINPVAHIVFVQEAIGPPGSPAYWWAKPRNQSRLGEMTIEVCKFNHPELRELRDDHFSGVVAAHVQALQAALREGNADALGAEFQRSLALLRPSNAYCALNYDALRQCVPNSELVAVLNQGWPEPEQVGW